MQAKLIYLFIHVANICLAFLCLASSLILTGYVPKGRKNPVSGAASFRFSAMHIQTCHRQQVLRLAKERS